MNFLTDQDLDRATVEFLRRSGHDVITAAQVGMSRAADSAILEYARQQRRIVITRDKGYGALVYPQGRPSNGVILLRVDPGSLDKVHVTLSAVLRDHTEGELGKSVVVVEPGKYRMRLVHSPRSRDGPR